MSLDSKDIKKEENAVQPAKSGTTDKNRKWKRLTGSICFLIVTALVIVGLNDALFEPNPKTEAVWEEVQRTDTDEPIDILFMGSSHIYRSTNPLTINEATGLNTMVLASDSQNIFQEVDNLNVLLKYRKPKMIVIEAYGTINRMMDTLVEDARGLVLMNIDGINNIFDRAAVSLREMGWQKVPEGALQLARPLLTWTRFKDHSDWEKERPDVQGSYDLLGYRPERFIVADGEVDMNYYNEKYAEEEKTVLPREINEEQERELRTLLQTAQDNDIEVWMVYIPTAEEKYFKNKWGSSLARVFEIASEYDCVTYADNWNYRTQEIGLDEGDFHHVAHLNPRGAQKSTEYFLKLFKEKKGIDYDLSKVFYYKTESSQQLADGSWRYTVENYQPAYYQFVLRKNGKKVMMQEYSTQNWFDSPYKIEDGYELEYSMLPIDTDLSDANERAERHLIGTFMVQRESDDGE